eukprot:TRINITY_DN226_c0_g1_i12.p1 TRINITY_DN226_c0_g1~~TRINITY_DN226_c0_g1_i12.p1  ORF type:complete len:207 (-),score=37.81 TRINITY_DN226_c0_g1_i12:756-1376(-)
MAPSRVLLLLCATSLVALVLAGPEPIHDIYSTSLPASAFRQKNLTNSGIALPAGTFRTNSVANMPGLRTLGNTFTTFRIEVGGHLTPHWHPRASELFYILSGHCNVSFIAQDPNDSAIFTLRTNALAPGDVAINPRGTLHWLVNTGTEPLLGFASFDAEDTGSMFINRLFLYVPTESLMAAFSIKKSVAKALQKETNFPFMFSVKA